MSNRPQPTARRDALRAIEDAARRRWASDSAALPEQGSDIVDGASCGDEDAPTYVVSTPLLEVHGPLMVKDGSALSKADFVARYQQLKGHRVVWPMGFDAAGDRVPAAAAKLREEIERFGAPPDEALLRAYDERRHFNTRTARSCISNRVWPMLESCGVPSDHVPAFQSPRRWIEFFPAAAIDDVRRFGVLMNPRHPFVTTDVNPYYDSFVRWHMRQLFSRGLLTRTTKMQPFSLTTMQPCQYTTDPYSNSRDNDIVVSHCVVKLLLENVSQVPALAAHHGVISDRRVFVAAALIDSTSPLHHDNDSSRPRSSARPSHNDPMAGCFNNGGVSSAMECTLGTDIVYGAYRMQWAVPNAYDRTSASVRDSTDACRSTGSTMTDSGEENEEEAIVFMTRHAAVHCAFQDNVLVNGAPYAVPAPAFTVRGADLVGASLSLPAAWQRRPHPQGSTRASACPDSVRYLSIRQMPPGRHARARGVATVSGTGFALSQAQEETGDEIGEAQARGAVDRSTPWASSRGASQPSDEWVAWCAALCDDTGAAFMLHDLRVGDAESIDPMWMAETISSPPTRKEAMPDIGDVGRGEERVIIAACDKWSIAYGDRQWTAAVDAAVHRAPAIVTEKHNRNEFDDAMRNLHHDLTCGRYHGLGSSPFDFEDLSESSSMRTERERSGGENAAITPTRSRHNDGGDEEAIPHVEKSERERRRGNRPRAVLDPLTDSVLHSVYASVAKFFHTHGGVDAAALQAGKSHDAASGTDELYECLIGASTDRSAESLPHGRITSEMVAGDALWNHVFKGIGSSDDVSRATGIPAATAAAMRREFVDGYPVDMHCCTHADYSVRSRLPLLLYHHVALWDGCEHPARRACSDTVPTAGQRQLDVLVSGTTDKGTGNDAATTAATPSLFPRSVFIHETVTRSYGGSANPWTMPLGSACLDKFGADATRLAFAYSGDGVIDDFLNKAQQSVTTVSNFIDHVRQLHCSLPRAPRSAGATLSEADGPCETGGDWPLDDATNDISVRARPMAGCDSESLETTAAAAGAATDDAHRHGSSEAARALFDSVFAAKIDEAITKSEAAFAALRFRAAVTALLYDLQDAASQYQMRCGSANGLAVMGSGGAESNEEGSRDDDGSEAAVPAAAAPGTRTECALLQRYIDTVVVGMSPIIPHACDFLWRDVLGHRDPIGSPGCQYPVPSSAPDTDALAADRLIAAVARDIHQKLKAAQQQQRQQQQQRRVRGAASARAFQPSAHLRPSVAPSFASGMAVVVTVAGALTPPQQRGLDLLRGLAVCSSGAELNGSGAANDADATTPTHPAPQGGAAEGASEESGRALPVTFPKDALTQIVAALRAERLLPSGRDTKQVMAFLAATKRIAETSGIAAAFSRSCDDFAVLSDAAVFLRDRSGAASVVVRRREATDPASIAAEPGRPHVAVGPPSK